MLVSWCCRVNFRLVAFVGFLTVFLLRVVSALSPKFFAHVCYARICCYCAHSHRPFVDRLDCYRDLCFVHVFSVLSLPFFIIIMAYLLMVEWKSCRPFLSCRSVSTFAPRYTLSSRRAVSLFVKVAVSNTCR